MPGYKTLSLGVFPNTLIFLFSNRLNVSSLSSSLKSQSEVCKDLTCLWLIFYQCQQIESGKWLQPTSEKPVLRRSLYIFDFFFSFGLKAIMVLLVFFCWYRTMLFTYTVSECPNKGKKEEWKESLMEAFYVLRCPPDRFVHSFKCLNVKVTWATSSVETFPTGNHPHSEGRTARSSHLQGTSPWL